MDSRILVLGLGRMGAALAATLLEERDNHVLVWNRTPSKAEPLLAAGASLAATVSAGVADSEIIVVCVGNYDDANQALGDCGDLTDKTLIQLTSGNVDDAEAMQNWALGKGAQYLDGVIAAYPSGIGNPETMLVVAGSEAAWQAAEKVVKALGGASMYVGTNLAAPIALEAAFVGPSLMATMGMIQGARGLEQAGLDVGLYAEMIGEMVPLMMDSLQRQARAIATNKFDDTEASLATWAAGIDHGVGGDTDLLEPIRALLHKAVEAGYGDEEIAAVIKVLRD